MNKAALEDGSAANNPITVGFALSLEEIDILIDGLEVLLARGVNRRKENTAVGLEQGLEHARVSLQQAVDEVNREYGEI